MITHNMELAKAADRTIMIEMVKSDEFDEDTHIKKLKAQQEKNYCHDSRNNSCNSAFVGACHTCVKLSVQYD